jgi:hypothetical protein
LLPLLFEKEPYFEFGKRAVSERGNHFSLSLIKLHGTDKNLNPAFSRLFSNEK